MTHLNPDQHRRLEDAVKSAETRTSAEFALVVTRASDGYAVYPLLWTALLSLTVAGIVAFALPAIGAAATVALQAALFVVAGFLFHAPFVRYRLVPDMAKSEQARQFARVQFFELVHNKTRRDVGILLFVSEAERHVEILVDRGISDRISDTVWQNIVDTFIGDVRQGRIAEGLIAAVDACAAVLQEKFPVSLDDRNEISDKVTEI